jgi:outer membrane protein, heavy metal efflux system
MHRIYIHAAILLAVAPVQGLAQAAPLTLAEAQAAALEHNPALRAARAAAEAVATRRAGAALPPDPELRLGVMNVSLPELRTDMPASMAPSIQLMQMVPAPGKLRLAAEVADRETGMARSAADAVAWQLRARTAAAFLAVRQADGELAVLHEVRGWLGELEEVARATYAAGRGAQGDALRAGVEAARMDAEIARVEAGRAASAARLNAAMGRPAGTPVGPLARPPLPASLPEVEVLAAWAGEGSPRLEGARTGLERAGTLSALARRELWPDLAVGLEYGQRPGAMGTERMGSVMVGFSLPVFAGRRQLARRADAEAMRQVAAAELAEVEAETSAELIELVAELARARALLALLRTEILPLGEATLTAALASYRSGRADFMTVVEARSTLAGFERERHTLEAESGVLIATLEMVVGRALPVDTLLTQVEP